jgi:hypothetical protein
VRLVPLPAALRLHVPLTGWRLAGNGQHHVRSPALHGAQVMLAHAPHVAYTTFLVIFGCLGFLPVAALRAQLGPPALGVNLGYAITSEGAQGRVGSQMAGMLLPRRQAMSWRCVQLEGMAGV